MTPDDTTRTTIYLANELRKAHETAALQHRALEAKCAEVKRLTELVAQLEADRDRLLSEPTASQA